MASLVLASADRYMRCLPEGVSEVGQYSQSGRMRKPLGCRPAVAGIEVLSLKMFSIAAGRERHRGVQDPAAEAAVHLACRALRSRKEQW